MNRRKPYPDTENQRPLMRAFDVAGALGLLVLTAPLLAVAAVLIRLSSPGPALFRQTRVGAGGREFELWKLRTMAVDAERETGPVLATQHDPRITAVGRWLRGSRFDEVPQLINVLTGEMSLVGPRPERPHFVRFFSREIRGYERRLLVKPGITGLAQVCGSYWMSAERTLHFDLAYIAQRSLGMDLRILLRTIVVVLRPGHAERQSREGFPEEPAFSAAARIMPAASDLPEDRAENNNACE